MHNELTSKSAQRIKRAQRVRVRLHGTRHKPRLSVFKSNKHISAQLIDDEAGVTLAHVSTYAKKGSTKPTAGKKAKPAKEHDAALAKKSKASAEALGREIAELAQKQQIKEMIFDRGCRKYHGILASLADAVRAAGIHL